MRNDEAQCTGGLFFAPRGNHGFAVIDAHHGVVRAKVSLKHATPNTTYGVELVQTPSGHGCNDYKVSRLTTNGHGDGNASVWVPQHPGDTGAFVGLFYGNYHDFYNTPSVALR